MTPASAEYESGSLKRSKKADTDWQWLHCYMIVSAGDPKKMFTDSSFYNSKYHPTIADQVEMAHKLSSAMFNEKNKWVQ